MASFVVFLPPIVSRNGRKLRLNSVNFQISILELTPFFFVKEKVGQKESIAFIDKIIAEETIQLDATSMACLAYFVCIP